MKIVEMYEVCPKNYTKSGKLMKRAKTEWSIRIGGDSDHARNDLPAKDIAESIVRYRNVESVESPYFFTHIILRADGKRYAIYERVLMAGEYLQTTPQTLFDALKKLIITPEDS